MEKIAIPADLVEIIDYAFSYIGSETNDWFRIKRELVNLFPSQQRSNFSRRHYSTKKHTLNLFDKAVIKLWEKKLGSKLWIDPNKLHPSDWVQRPSGWGLQKYNEQRKAAARNSD